MKYGVIICPKCGKARGVESRRKTTTCQCGRKIILTRMKLQFPTDSPHELANIVGKVNASLKGGGPMPSAKKKRKTNSYTAISEKAKVTKDPLEKMRLIVAELAAQKSELDADDFKQVATMIGKENLEDLIVRLLDLGIIYEIGPGKFKAV